MDQRHEWRYGLLRNRMVRFTMGDRRKSGYLRVLEGLILSCWPQKDYSLETRDSKLFINNLTLTHGP